MVENSPNLLLPTAPATPGEPILICLTGSHAYNTNRPESDVDFRGVYACTAREMLSLRPPQETVDLKHPDVTLHELRKFCKLAAASNTTVLEVLWASPVIRKPGGDALINNRKMFLSKRARNTYGGYARQQLVKAERGSGGPRGVEHFKREKFMLHLLRLMEAGLHLLEEGEVLVRVPEPDRLREMARWPLDDIKDYVASMEIAMNMAMEHTNLPDEPDYEAIDATMDWIRSTVDA